MKYNTQTIYEENIYDSLDSKVNTFKKLNFKTINLLSLDFWKNIEGEVLRNLTTQHFLSLPKYKYDKIKSIVMSRIMNKEFDFPYSIIDKFPSYKDQPTFENLADKYLSKFKMENYDSRRYEILDFTLKLRNIYGPNEEEKIKFWVNIPLEKFLSLPSSLLGQLDLYDLEFFKSILLKKFKSNNVSKQNLQKTRDKFNTWINIYHRRSLPDVFVENSKYISKEKIFYIWKYRTRPSKSAENKILKNMRKISVKEATYVNENDVLDYMNKSYTKSNGNIIETLPNRASLFTPKQALAHLGLQSKLRSEFTNKCDHIKIPYESKNKTKSKKILFYKSDLEQYAINHLRQLSQDIIDKMTLDELILRKEKHSQTLLNNNGVDRISFSIDEISNRKFKALNKDQKEIIKQFYSFLWFSVLFKPSIESIRVSDKFTEYFAKNSHFIPNNPDFNQLIIDINKDHNTRYKYTQNKEDFSYGLKITLKKSETSTEKNEYKSEVDRVIAELIDPYSSMFNPPESICEEIFYPQTIVREEKEITNQVISAYNFRTINKSIPMKTKGAFGFKIDEEIFPSLSSEEINEFYEFINQDVGYLYHYCISSESKKAAIIFVNKTFE
ncbi:MAG: hypothetical protein ACOCQD_04105, partial [archaeon]